VCEKENIHKKFDLQERLIDYLVMTIHVYEQLSDTRAFKHITFQILKSGSLPVANYGEAKNAEFRSDFIYFDRELI